MNKNTVIGFLLIGLVLIAYSYYTRPTPAQIAAANKYNDSIAAVNAQQQLEAAKEQQSTVDTTQSTVLSDSVKESRLQNTYGEFSHAAEGEETFVPLENELLKVVLSSKGGRIYSVQLKNFTDKDNQTLTLFDGNDESEFGITLITANNRILNTKDLYFQTITEGNKITMRLNAGDAGSLDYIYTLEPNDYMLRFEIVSRGLEQILSPSTNSLDIQWQQKARQQETGRNFESRFSRLTYKYAADESAEQLSESREASQDIPNNLRWIAFKNQYFSSVLIANEHFEETKLASTPFTEGKYIKDYSATTTVPFDIKGNNPTLFHYYFGPLDYQLLRQYDRNQFKGQDLQLEKLVPLGWSLFRYVNKWIIIPIFDFWAAICGNIGIAILLLTLTIKTLLFPLSYKSFMSSAKMRVMRPQVDVINEKYPGQENAMTRQKKTMELYGQAGVSPMSGCLPMLLQMPFLFALFWFFPAAIQLRHVSFLWANDLSTYDAIISWNTYVPFVTRYFGNHISLFCLLMTITQIFNTKYNMDQSAGQQQMPGMKTMMYFMPVFMMIFLNQYPAGLNYYYFISTLITVLQMVVFRYFVNEEKLLAQLEENKKKPKKKKSGFMARLEEAQRQQQTLAKQRTTQQRKTGKR